MVRTPAHKWFVRNGREYLYDLSADPFEMNDLIDSPAHQHLAEEARARLGAFLMATQVNYSADYKNLFTRIGLTAERREGMAERLLAMFRDLHWGTGDNCRAQTTGNGRKA